MGAAILVNAPVVELYVPKRVDVGVPLKTPLGLIASELISNSLKHAFPDSRGGTILVELTDKKEIGYQLLIHDTGIGLPDGFVLENTSSLGLRLVKILINQIIFIKFTKNNSFFVEQFFNLRFFLDFFEDLK